MSGPTNVVPPSVAGAPDEESDAPGVESVLTAVADPDCRAIVSAIGTDTLTASECSAACDLPLSTTYRKLDRLVEAGLLAEHVRIRRDGKHCSQYRRDFSSVRLAVDGDGEFRVDVAAPSEGSGDA